MRHQDFSTEASKLARLPRVCDLTVSSPATTWRRVRNDPSFPRPLKLSAGITAWVEAEVIDWVEAKKAERGAA